MARIIELQEEKEITIFEKQSVLSNKISVNSVTDNGNSVMCNISFFSQTGHTKSLVLWEGKEYDNIGQWTDTDVNNRILEILK